MAVQRRGDNRRLGTYTLMIGKPVEIDLDVTGVLRLECERTVPALTRDPLVLGDARLTRQP
ncbi:hypothetical protein I6A84_40025 [Frankia sp. CNm7]|uniref:Uncharacterized protein n=1 Tax=Frankia nepalensis TaxID=1836974 RepID=A0A937USI4_9ACTN|nr:hypothetical protein [Frankia nepalensis]MBL7498354.1 hypothetical protein [Frankia nepalensis]MBL7513237.1 hypothetical protein [Frankia nepalensis]MBL7524068.1 hypothetical protein [Frankia nepalensis]MBL7628921.1 hypothetical protein [Frankia nepalensis]